jgi:hypothetical protein
MLRLIATRNPESEDGQKIEAEHNAEKNHWEYQQHAAADQQAFGEGIMFVGLRIGSGHARHCSGSTLI